VIVSAGSPGDIEAASLADVERCTPLASAMTEANAIFFWVAVKLDVAALRVLVLMAFPRVSMTDVAVAVSIPVESEARLLSVLNEALRSPAEVAEFSISAAS
jgi:hypothetical protein